MLRFMCDECRPHRGVAGWLAGRELLLVAGDAVDAGDGAIHGNGAAQHLGELCECSGCGCRLGIHLLGPVGWPQLAADVNKLDALLLLLGLVHKLCEALASLRIVHNLGPLTPGEVTWHEKVRENPSKAWIHGGKECQAINTQDTQLFCETPVIKHDQEQRVKNIKFEGAVLVAGDQLCHVLLKRIADSKLVIDDHSLEVVKAALHLLQPPGGTCEGSRSLDVEHEEPVEDLEALRLALVDSQKLAMGGLGSAVAADVDVVSGLGCNESKVLALGLGALTDTTGHRRLELVWGADAAVTLLDPYSKPHGVLQAVATPCGANAALHGA
eukprot:scaffold191446_cov46-Prasinocladus_malaysianus.AAC.2